MEHGRGGHLGRPDRAAAAGRLGGGFHGAWHGAALPLATPDNSFTVVFTPAGAIRAVTSTADAGIARVTLRPGAQSAFQAACRALAAAH